MSRLLIVLALIGCGHPQGSARPERGPEGSESKGADAAAAIAPSPDAAPAADAAPPPLAQDPAALAAGLVALYEDVAAATATGDCAAIASAIGALQPKHAPLVAALRKADAAGRSADVKTALDPYKDRVHAALDAITTRTAPCGKDPAVERAIDALFGGGA